MRKQILALLLLSVWYCAAFSATLIPYKSNWKYLDNGTDQGTAWSATAFADAGWPGGNAELGYGDADEATTVSYGADANNKYITTYFRKTFTLSETYQSFTLNLIRDDGAVVYVNGVEVYRNNMPAGAVLYTTLASGSAADDGSAQQTVVLAASNFTAGTNTIAVEVHQNAVSSSDLSFDLQLIGNRAESATLVSWNSVWKYLDNGTDQTTAWIPAAYSDAAWAKGPGELGYGDADEATTVSFGADANNKYITTYFRKTFANPGGFSSYTLSLKSDDGVAVYVNGTEVYRNNLSAAALYNTLATASAVDDGNTPQVVVIPSSAFTAGENTIAVEVHQSAITTSDLSFDAELTGNVTINPALVSFGERWKYLDDGTNQGTAWRPTAFADAAWAQGWAEFGYGDGDENTVVSYGANSASKHEVTYFRKVFNLSSVAAFKGYTIKTFRDDGLVIYVNGTEVWRNNIPYGTVAYTTLATEAATDDGNVYQTVVLPASAFSAGDNCIAVSIHQSAVNSSDLSFDLQLEGNTDYEITRGVYLQSGSHSGVKLCFKTNSAVAATIRYGTTIGSLTGTVTEGAANTMHEIPVSGLQPNTKYYYEVTAGAHVMQGGDLNYFVTAPVPGSTQEINIWATGDCGTGYDEQEFVRNQYLNYMRNAGNKHTDVWMLVGDNAYDAGLDAEYQTGFFDMYQDSVLRNVLLYPAPGNHDYANNATRQNDHNVPYYSIFSVPTAAELGGVPSGTEAYYSYNYGNIHFISLDSYGKEANTYRVYDTLGPQTVWLKNDLAANTQPWVIVYCHHPPYTMGSHNSDTESELINMRSKLLPILERYKADLLICGHSHCYERSHLMKGHYGLETTFNSATHDISSSSAQYDGSANSCPYVKNTPDHDYGTVYVVTGSAGKFGGSQAAYPHNAMQYSNFSIAGSTAITVKGNRLDAKFIDQSGNVLDKFTIMKEVNKHSMVNQPLLDSTLMNASWSGSYNWSPVSGSSSSLQVSPASATSYYVSDNENCLRDTFDVTVIIPTLTTVDPALGSICRGNSFNLSFTKTGKFFPGNIFKAELSDAFGSFASPDSIGILADTAAGIISCTIPAATAVGSGYRVRVVASIPAINGTDNGTDFSVTAPLAWYLDADNDGHYLGAEITQCSSPGAGYNTTATVAGDCDDADNLVWQTADRYTDADNDGYGTGALVTLCYGNTLPAFYSAANGDCNDANAAINPASAEICGNATDDNCNTLTDEGCISITGTATNTICTGSANGSINITVGNGTLPYSFSWSNAATTEDVSALAAGTYSVTVTDNTSSTASAVFTVGTTVPAAKPGTPGVVTGTAKICKTQSYTYSILPVANASSYTWTAPANASITAGQGTTQITVLFSAAYASGNVTVTASNCKGTSGARTFVTSLLIKPGTPGLIAGATGVCEADYTYSVAAVINATTYTWTLPANTSIVSGQGTNTITLHVSAAFVSGTLSVLAGNCAGNSTARTLAIAKIPPAPAAITGAGYNICGVTTGLVYSIAPIPGAVDYTWVVTGGTLVSGQGTTAITVNFPAVFTSATIKVKQNTACSTNGVFRTVTVYQRPAPPGTITGNASVCPATANTYSIAAVPGAVSYTWAVPADWTITSGQGSASITATAGMLAGNVSVIASNACKPSTAKTKAVTIAACKTDGSAAVEESVTEVSELKIYPNPTSDLVTLEYSAAYAGSTRIAVRSANGKLIKDEALLSAKGVNKTTFSLAGQANGIYFVTINDGTKTRQLKVVKQ